MQQNILKYSLVALGLCAVLSIGLNFKGCSDRANLSSQLSKLKSSQKSEIENIKEQIKLQSEQLEAINEQGEHYAKTGKEIATIREAIKNIRDIQDLDYLIARYRYGLHLCMRSSLLSQQRKSTAEHTINYLMESSISVSLLELAFDKTSLQKGCRNIYNAIKDKNKQIDENKDEYAKDFDEMENSGIQFEQDLDEADKGRCKLKDEQPEI